MHDTVREELETKVGKLPSNPRIEIPLEVLEQSRPSTVAKQPDLLPVKKLDPAPTPAPVRPKAITAELKKKETSPTLVDFQHKSPFLSD